VPHNGIVHRMWVGCDCKYGQVLQEVASTVQTLEKQQIVFTPLVSAED